MSKSGSRRERQQERLEQQRRSRRIYAFTVAVLVAGLGVTVVLTGGASKTPGSNPADAQVERSGEASALGIEADAQTVALGHVPLNTTVEPSWRLVNRGSRKVSLGEPHAEVVEGCCPGPLQLGAHSLAPGESTELTFPLQMHEGMDGAHDFNIHVPVTSAEGEDLLELRTTGHFSS